MATGRRPVFDFSTTSALVTGATSGMGAAIATGLAQSGAQVVIAGRDSQRAKALISSLGQDAKRVRFIPGDISDSDYCQRLVEQASAELGNLDLVVNSAGVIYHATAEHTTDEQWLHTLCYSRPVHQQNLSPVTHW